MPRVQQYGGQQVETTVTQGPRARAPAAEAFGATHAAAAVGQAGTAFGQMSQRIAETEAEEALVQFEKMKNQTFFDPENGYFNTQGRNAYDGATGTLERLQEMKEEFGTGLTTDAARQMFDRAATQHLTRAEQDVMRHASKGLDAWELATIKAQTENTLENAMLYWNDPERLEVQRELGRQGVIDSGQRAGIGSEAINENLQTYDSSFYRNAVEAAVRQSADAADELYTKVRERMEPQDRFRMEDAIAARRKTEHTQFTAAQAVNTATVLVEQYESRGEILDEINKITDPELRKATTSEAMYQFNQRQTARSEARAEAFEAAERHVMEGQSPESFKAANPDMWERMSAKQRRSIEQGEGVTTDYNVLTNLLLLEPRELAKLDPVEYYDQIAPSDRNRLVSAVKTARGQATAADRSQTQVGRTRAAEVKSVVDRIFGDNKKWKDEEKAQVDAFYSLITDEVEFREQEKGGPLTAAEHTALLGEMTRKLVRERTLWFNKELDLTDVPAEHVPVLTEFLRGRGIPVTADNLIRAYEQARTR